MAECFVSQTGGKPVKMAFGNISIGSWTIASVTGLDFVPTGFIIFGTMASAGSSGISLNAGSSSYAAYYKVGESYVKLRCSVDDNYVAKMYHNYSYDLAKLEPHDGQGKGFCYYNNSGMNFFNSSKAYYRYIAWAD